MNANGRVQTGREGLQSSGVHEGCTVVCVKAGGRAGWAGGVNETSAHLKGCLGCACYILLLGFPLFCSCAREWHALGNTSVWVL